MTQLNNNNKNQQNTKPDTYSSDAMIQLDNLYKTYDSAAKAQCQAYALAMAEAGIRVNKAVNPESSPEISKPKNLVLDGVSLQVATGDIFAVIGKSGAGKSTLLRVINQLTLQDAGGVIVAGQQMDKLKADDLRQARRSIGIIFQHFNLLDVRTVFDNVALALQVTKMPAQDIRQKVNEVLRLVELEDKKDAYPDQLSGGQKQRVAIARALVSSPKVLLCDEATSALDAESTAQILQLLKKINVKLGVTIFMITHELDVVRRICSQVAVMHAGRVVESGSALEVLLHPQHPVTQRLLVHELEQEEGEALPSASEIASKPDKRSAKKIELVRLLYVGHETDAPILSQLQQHFNVQANILQAKIESISGARVGHILCELQGDAHNIEQAKLFLQQQKIELQLVAS